MISQSAKKVLEKFVSTAKNLLMQNVTELLQQYYGIWADGHTIPVEQLANQDTDIVHTARMLRERMKHLLAALPENETQKEKLAVGQLIAEQAFTQLNRFCALRMCEERELILESIRSGYESVGFQSYDAIASQIAMPKYNRYKWYLHSIFDELSVELPAVFDRFSPYGLVFPDENTLLRLLELINDTQLSEWYDEQNGMTVNFWKEDETLGWMFQDYNSLEERRKMREESNKPRNSREMAVRNQFFTPEYIVRFLTDNSLGRIWYEMTGGQSRIGEEQCLYMVRRPDEIIENRAIKEPTEILSMDPTCGSMHFGLYLYEVYEYIYMDAWDNHPNLLIKFREIHTRDSFHREVPRLILENNIYGCEIDPRALQIAALSLWLRAQRSFSEMNIDTVERPLITKSNLILAESMPGNKKLLNGLMEEMEKPMQNLIKKIWDKMQFVGEAGLLFKMEKEIDEEIDYLRKNWTKVNQYRYADLFATDEERAKIEMENEARRVLKENKEEFFKEITERLKEALQQLSAKLSEEEGYENALFSDDATRGFAFIELCQKRFDCIVMNPPFGEGSEHTSGYLDDNYPAWCRNLVCAFFDRMQEMLDTNGRLGAIFDRTVMIKSSYESFRKRNLCGFITHCADTGWGVLDASVETSTLVLNKNCSNIEGLFYDVWDVEPSMKSKILFDSVHKLDSSILFRAISKDFINLPNTIVGYKFDGDLLKYFRNPNIEHRGLPAQRGMALVADVHFRLFFEIGSNTFNYRNIYEGSSYTLFYTVYRDVLVWEKEGVIAWTYPNFRPTGIDYVATSGLCYGKRGEIVDTHIKKRDLFFTVEGQSIPNLNASDSFTMLSFTNSIISQYSINLYTGQHKPSGYMNLLPMPDYQSRQSDIETIVTNIIEIKRHFFSLDETNLEYHGLIAQLNISSTIESALDNLQSAITADYTRYQELVEQNDDLWMDLAKIDRNSDFRKTLNEYKSRRPYEELLSIDGASSQNIIDKKVMAQEIMMELVGMAFGRWDTAYAKGQKTVPEFGDVFDALPFMPVVSLSEVPVDYAVNIPEDGILSNQTEGAICLSSRVRDVMHYLWGERADDLEYELCKLIGCKNLQTYFETPTGFFEYHFKRYTKSRRKAPIYWPLSSEDGSLTYWVYYPKLSKNTLPSLILKLRDENESIRSSINNALVAHDKIMETDLRAKQQQVEGMIEEITRIIDLGYEPNHDDGVPVTSCPLVNLIHHRGWNTECAANYEELQKGEYDWSHLAMSMFPSRVTQKAKKDWCMALTHGLEHLCENKPKEKKPRKKKAQSAQIELNFD
ncbi:BREX-1 system adenine-specific DNA-methyltransferase PglX [Segatella bryantii]|uniref:BREX-1 system adenine-specific DNA-methyltransferase PglX n=1 Tax=Segatella bryantii TaxID=77095 RepID=UPI001EDACF3B|nr:BREX-1 system adenine-specific DNA-methyltransferase PglX [Segatella bryantii]UKK73423.1 BREX-1 system adenine-specific DNA-methyltransferase PglX [Segatella bryantii]